MGSASTPTTSTSDFKAPSAIPGTTDVSRGTAEESSLSRELAKSRKRKGFSSTDTGSGLAPAQPEGKSLLGA